eukprot:11604524-Alexandrium_andersonii.AAC.1
MTGVPRSSGLWASRAAATAMSSASAFSYRVRPPDMDRSLNPQWESGVWLGRRRGTAAHIVA